MPRLLKELSYLRQSKLSIVTLLAPIFLVGSLAVVSYELASQNVKSSDWVVHTYAVIQEIESELRNLLEIESSARGYVITGDQDYLQTYNMAWRELQPRLKRITALTADNPAQHTNVVEWETLAAAKMAYVESLIEQRKTAGAALAMETVNAGEGKTAMNQIREVARRMENEERRLLSVRSERSIRSAYRVQLACIAFLWADAVVFIAMLALVVRIGRLQNLVKVCAWTKRIEYNGRWLRFEEYLEQRFGVRTTHGMSEDAVEKMKAELEALPGTKR